MNANDYTGLILRAQGSELNAPLVVMCDGFQPTSYSQSTVDAVGMTVYDPAPSNRAKLENNPTLLPSLVESTNEQAWTAFRFGPTAFTPYENTRFPIKAQDQYFAQIVPNTETSYPDGGQNTIAALGALLDRIGPAVVMVHSQSGAYGLSAAIDRPNLVRAVVSVEPRSCALSDENVKAVFTRVKLLTMSGDFFGSNVSDWPGRMAECVDAVTRIRAPEESPRTSTCPIKAFAATATC